MSQSSPEHRRAYYLANKERLSQQKKQKYLEKADEIKAKAKLQRKIKLIDSVKSGVRRNFTTHESMIAFINFGSVK